MVNAVNATLQKGKCALGGVCVDIATCVLFLAENFSLDMGIKPLDQRPEMPLCVKYILPFPEAQPHP